LSENLLEILAQDQSHERLTLNQVLLRTEGRGIFLLIVLLCFPFLTPVTIPGPSTPLGAVILFLALRMALDRPPSLPLWMGGRPLPMGFQKVIKGSIRVLRFLEKWLVRPRKTTWLGWRPIRCLNGLVLALMAFLLALPLPFIVPLTNTLPSYAILLLSLSMMEEDGAMIWAGYAVALGTVAYFSACAGAILQLWQRYYEPMTQWLANLL
jgi:hypothetical protein